MKIEELKQSDISHYETLSENHGTLFNSLSWLKMFGDKVNLYGLYAKDGRLIGGFHLYQQRKMGFKIYRNPPFTPTIGPIIKIEAKKPVSIMATWKRVLSLISDFMHSLPYSIISLRLSTNVVDTQPFFWSKFKVIPNYTYIINLTQPIETIWNNLSSNHRNHMKKAIKSGLVTKQIDDLRIVKDLVLKTFARQKKKFDSFYLDKILFEYTNNSNSFAFATFKNNKVSSCALFVYDNDKCYLIASGYDELYKHHGAGILTKWEGIKYAHNLNLKLFDFEGSMIKRIEMFNRGFGGELTPYYTINKARLPIELILKCFKRELF
jgi:hypothetical protein